MTDRLRLLIADRAPTRVAIRTALADEVDIVAEVDDSEQAIRVAMREQPDLCLVETTSPAMGSPRSAASAVRRRTLRWS